MTDIRYQGNILIRSHGQMKDEPTTLCILVDAISFFPKKIMLADCFVQIVLENWYRAREVIRALSKPCSFRFLP